MSERDESAYLFTGGGETGRSWYAASFFAQTLPNGTIIWLHLNVYYPLNFSRYLGFAYYSTAN